MSRRCPRAVAYPLSARALFLANNTDMRTPNKALRARLVHGSALSSWQHYRPSARFGARCDGTVPATIPQDPQRSGIGHQRGLSNRFPQRGQMNRAARKWPYTPASPQIATARFVKNFVSKCQFSGVTSAHSGKAAGKAPHLSLTASRRSAQASSNARSDLGKAFVTSFTRSKGAPQPES